MKSVEKSKLYAVIGLCVVAVFVAYFRFFHKKGPAQPRPVALPAAMQPMVEVPPLPLADYAAELIQPAAMDAFEPASRDLFSPAVGEQRPVVDEPPTNGTPIPAVGPRTTVTGQPGPKRPHLKGIMKAGGVPVAIVDGRLVQEGSQVGPYKVVRISGDKVVLESPTERITLGF